jgi:hypothetical protein
MKVTYYVIRDLLPLVQSGEASPDTRALVEEFLREHPEWAQSAVPLDRNSAPDPEVEPPLQLEKRTLERTKRLIRLRSWLMGLGIFLMLSPMMTYFRTTTVDGRKVSRIEWQMARDHPRLAVLGAGVGISCWAAWFVLRRRLRATAL